MSHRGKRSLTRRRWLALAPLIVPALHADPSNGNPRLEKLFLMFMAPCCWRENLLAHQSPKADELRAVIQKQVSQGLTDDQIRTAMVNEFTSRILTHPEGAAGNILRWTPWAAAAAGTLALGAFIRFSLKNRPAAQFPDNLQLPEWDLDDLDMPPGKK
ncbi:MAG TPA: cytochrome c-type biogenesis protein CcmH [Bryobacteraceae bacterium]|nr:cytochrome c-type biogenesis protein CcmH [Bryobacteraceae bacterium]